MAVLIDVDHVSPSLPPIISSSVMFPTHLD